MTEENTAVPESLGTLIDMYLHLGDDIWLRKIKKATFSVSTLLDSIRDDSNWREDADTALVNMLIREIAVVISDTADLSLELALEAWRISRFRANVQESFWIYKVIPDVFKITPTIRIIHIINSWHKAPVTQEILLGFLCDNLTHNRPALGYATCAKDLASGAVYGRTSPQREKMIRLCLVELTKEIGI